MRKTESNWDRQQIDFSFPYFQALIQGQPERGKEFPKHPSMDRGHRAKIFAPFDALDGFSALIQQKDRLLEEAASEKAGTAETEGNIRLPWEHS